MRAISVLVAFFLCGVAVAAPPTAYLHPQQLVAVQGARRLNLYCIGQGSPTVLFDSGAADSTAVWRLVQPVVAKTTRACAYDRAAYGFSDPPVGPSDAKAAVADIHRLIVAAPITGPIVYVGHSIAGLYGVLLAGTYPGDVAAEVLVDPTLPNEYFAMSAPLTPKLRAEWLAGNQSTIDRMRKCAAMQGPLPKDCLGTDLQTGPGDTELASLERKRVTRRSYILANASEFESTVAKNGQKSVDQKELEAVPPNFGNKPLIILTHSKSMQNPELTASQNAAIERAFNEGHNQMAALSTRGSNIIVPNSDHYIQMDQPQAVIDAVLKAVAEVRKGTNVKQ